LGKHAYLETPASLDALVAQMKLVVALKAMGEIKPVR